MYTQLSFTYFIHTHAHILITSFSQHNKILNKSIYTTTAFNTLHYITSQIHTTLTISTQYCKLQLERKFSSMTNLSSVGPGVIMVLSVCISDHPLNIIDLSNDTYLPSVVSETQTRFNSSQNLRFQ